VGLAARRVGAHAAAQRTGRRAGSAVDANARIHPNAHVGPACIHAHARVGVGRARVEAGIARILGRARVPLRVAEVFGRCGHILDGSACVFGQGVARVGREGARVVLGHLPRVFAGYARVRLGLPAAGDVFFAFDAAGGASREEGEEQWGDGDDALHAG
jgi:hypothetical protein